MIKKLLLSAAAIFTLMATDAQQLVTPQPSPTASVKQNFALSSIELDYSRPGVKGRKIFGDLVPYGKVWRTGANNATTITFGDEVTIGGKKIPAGKYGLLTIPGEKEWTVIVTKQLDVTSPDAYKQDQDVVRVQAEVQTLPFAIESFMIDLGNIKPSSLEMTFLWDNVAVAVPISSDVEGKVMAQIDNLMNKDSRPYFGAAMYYLENGKDLKQALVWFDKAVEQQPNAFWVYHQRANALAKLGKKTEARASANRSIELAKEAKNDDYVRLNEKLLAELK
jgi:tetratricopeptide (TPR) repeat protein